MEIDSDSDGEESDSDEGTTPSPPRSPQALRLWSAQSLEEGMTEPSAEAEPQAQRLLPNNPQPLDIDVGMEDARDATGPEALRLWPSEMEEAQDVVPEAQRLWPSDGHKLQLLESDSEEETVEWEVERILEKRFSENGTEYHVKWMNSDETTWEPKSNMTQCKDAMRDYKCSNPSFVVVKDLQKNLNLPKFTHQPSDYYRKVTSSLLLIDSENCMCTAWDCTCATPARCTVWCGMSMWHTEQQMTSSLQCGSS